MATALATQKHRIHVSDDARFLTAGQVMERYGVSKMFLVRKMAAGLFPKPVHLAGSRIRFWKRADLEAFERGAVS
jgi:predicted DNA-binding transcriptional regulator AlpA